MGMSSSQVRLLTITSRMHDLEYRSQQLANVKLCLSRQSERVSAEYNAALDQQYLQMYVLPGGASSRELIDATYNSMCMFNPNMVKDQYLLVDSTTNAIYVDKRTREAYENAKGDKARFVSLMIGDASASSTTTETSGDSTFTRTVDKPFTDEEQAKIDDITKYPSNYPDIDSAAFTAALNDLFANFTSEKAETFLDDFGISTAAQTTSTESSSSTSSNNDTKNEEAWYGNIFDRIQAADGEMVDLPEGKANDNEWLTNMIQGGYIRLDKYDRDHSVPKWEAVTTATDFDLDENANELAIKKAELKYETETKKINEKEKRIDNELNMINTEHEALKTEHDAVKNVIKDNIDKTFNIFS